MLAAERRPRLTALLRPAAFIRSAHTRDRPLEESQAVCGEIVFDAAATHAPHRIQTSAVKLCRVVGDGASGHTEAFGDVSELAPVEGNGFTTRPVSVRLRPEARHASKSDWRLGRDLTIW